MCLFSTHYTNMCLISKQTIDVSMIWYKRNINDMIYGESIRYVYYVYIGQLKKLRM